VDIQIRQATEEDFGEIARLDSVAFGFEYTQEGLEDARTIIDLARFLVATESGRVVGVAGDYPFTMTGPGGTLDVPGVTWVSVSPTYRRRGTLRALMDHQLLGYASHGVAAAVLTASEGGIYGRFGYGPASQVRKAVVHRRSAVLRSSVETPGEVVVASAEQARRDVPGIHDRWRAGVPGALSRNEAWWDYLFLDREFQRGGMTRQLYLLHPDGYVAYRTKSDWQDGHAGHICRITDYVTVTPEAHAALWRVLLGMDLYGTIESYQIPIDDPLPFLLADGRQIRTTGINDGLWVRPIDVAAMLSTRRYSVEVDAVIEISDELFGSGRYLLKGGPDGSICEPTGRSADLTLTAAALGSAYLGGYRLHTLALAGAARIEDPALLARLDRAFLSDRAPFHGTGF
jgi:predicted acetyltransferase